MSISLWPHQIRTFDLLRESYQRLPETRRRTVAVLPTGAGKTTIGAEYAARKTSFGRKTLWIAHRTELIDQAAARLIAAGLCVGTVSARTKYPPNPYAPVQVASIQTLMSRGTRPEADAVVWDECHHTSASTYKNVFAAYPTAQHLGLTATPERADGKPLNEFEDLIVGATYSELIAQGYLVDCEVIAPARPLKPGEIAQRPVDAYDKHTPGQSALVFAGSIEAGHTMVTDFGGRAELLTGKTPEGTRRTMLERFEQGQLKIIVNCSVLSEGTDLPICAVVILARGCGTQGLYIQITGRALRRYPGKTHATLLDLRGVSNPEVHGSPTADRVYSLTGEKGISVAGAPNPYPACLVCGAPKVSGDACAECGAKPLSRDVTVTGDELRKWDMWRLRPDNERVKSLAKWIKDGRVKGWKEGAVRYKYRGVFGHFPPDEIMREAERLLQDG